MVNIDICKCYPSVLLNNNTPIPVYSIHYTITPFTHVSQLGLCGEFYIDETEIKVFRATIKIEAGFYSGDLIQYLVEAFHMPTRNIKWEITTKRALKPETFRDYIKYLFNTFSEAKAKKLANSFIGELGRK